MLLATVTVLCALGLNFRIARAQESASAQTVPRGTIQVEGGIGYTRVGGERETDYGGLLVRTGIDPVTEIRIGIPSYIRLRGDGRASGFGDASISFERTLFGNQKSQLAPVAGNEGQTPAQKQAENDAKGRARTKRAGASGAQPSELPKPALGLILGTNLPTASGDLGSNRFEPAGVLAFEASLSPSTSLASNLGYTSVAGQQRRFGQFFGSLAVGYSLNSKLGVFGEIFGTRDTGSQGTTQAFFNVGAVYIVNDNFELDAGLAPSLSDNPTRNYQLGLGFTKRF